MSVATKWSPFVGPVVWVAILLAAILSGSSFWIYNWTLIAIYTIVLVGLNAMVGYAGQVSFAQTAFMAVGGYGVAILGANHGWNPWLAFVTSVLLAGAFAVVMGVPLFRLRGHYLTMATFAFAMGAYALSIGADFTGGAIGISAVPPLRIGQISFVTPVPALLLASLICAASMVVLNVLRSSHVGRSWRALAVSEDVAESLGLNVWRYKMLAFVLASVLAAVGGALYVEVTSYVSPDLYNGTIIVDLFMMFFIGGRGTTFGPLVGATVFLVVPQLISELSGYQGIVFDLLLLSVILLLPQGLLGGISTEGLVSSIASWGAKDGKTAIADPDSNS